uniref:Lipocalin n=1 Tax=Rhipicephalus appendiculatus TaxID=34631 RepID=A0A131Z475_RHIAP
MFKLILVRYFTFTTIILLPPRTYCNSGLRELLQMLTSQRVWIYAQSYKQYYRGRPAGCFVYNKEILRRTFYNFSFDIVTDLRTYYLEYYARLGVDVQGNAFMSIYGRRHWRPLTKALKHWDNVRRCGILKFQRQGQDHCELLVWDRRIRQVYEQHQNYTDCHEEYRTHCGNASFLVQLHRSCPNFVSAAQHWKYE